MLNGPQLAVCHGPFCRSFALLKHAYLRLVFGGPDNSLVRIRLSPPPLPR